ncbi:MAG: prenyltransferase/squalene oxidase repeat-containing protein [Thermomicrobiales bacterium]
MISHRLRRSAFAAAGLLLTLMLLVGLAPATTAVESQPDAAGRAADWLQSQQLDNGAFPGFTGDADPSTTADAVIAIASTGTNPASVTSPSGNDPVSYLTGLAGDAAADPGAASKLMLALHAARGDALDPTDVDGVDLASALTGGYNPDTGFYGPGLFISAYSILALAATGQPVEQGAIDTLLASQIEDGSWNFNGDTTPGTGDSNTTAIVVQALVSVGAGPAQVTAGLDYLAILQSPDGSIAFDASEDPLVGDANSTAVAIQAFIAAGRNPSSLPNGDAVAALAGFQQLSGALTWRNDLPEDNTLATVQAIPALLGQALPVNHLGVVPTPPDGPGAVDAALAPATGLGTDGCLYFVETFHNVCGSFARYWQANGGLKIFGYPLTESYIEDGVEVQYFERTRLEHHPDTWPENFDILQGRLGAEQLGLGD